MFVIRTKKCYCLKKKLVFFLLFTLWGFLYDYNVTVLFATERTFGFTFQTELTNFSFDHFCN